MGIFSKGGVGGRQGGDSPKGARPKRVIHRRGKTAGKGQVQNKRNVGGQGKKSGGKGGAADDMGRWA
jgi:hypothetical protein